MHRFAFLLVAAMIMPVGCAPGRVSQPDPTLIQSDPAAMNLAGLEALRDAFVERVNRLGLELPYRPQMREWTRPSLISFREEERAVAVPRYSELSPKTAELLEACGGREFFELAFRWFFPAHELAHFLQVEFGWQGDHALAERLANDLATAFHAGQPGGRIRLQRLAVKIEAALAAFPDPTPTGQDPDQYFNSNYHSLAGQPRKYGAFQWRFVLDSLRRADRLNFEQLARELVQQNRVATAVMLDPALDAGFHVAAHLHLPDVAITLYDPGYVEDVKAVRRQLIIPDLLISTRADHLSRELNQNWRVHRLVRVPALFLDFEDTRRAFDLLLREEPISAANRRVYERLKSHLLPLYPYLERLAGWEHQLARELVALIDYEYASFQAAYHRIHRKKWDWARRKFRNEWYRLINPAVAALNSENRIRQVVIVLSPALRRHGKSYRIHGGIGRVAALLPQNPQEMDHALLYAFHELCHGITDPLVYQSGHRREDLSFHRKQHGKQLHNLLEAAANQAMFLSLGETNPEYQTRFLKGMGNLNWLAKNDLLAKRLRFAGRDLTGDETAELRQGLARDPLEFSRRIYRQGLLIPAVTHARLQALVPKTAGR